MCAIIDANTCHEIVGSNTTVEGRLFADWLESGGGILVIGGKVTTEISRNGNVVRYLGQLRAAGRLRVADSTAVEAETKRLGALTDLASDDPHVLAVAIVAGAKLLFSRDQNLHKDYLNRQLIGFRGSVYQGQRNLLRRDVCRDD